MIKDLVIKARSYRRFVEEPISEAQLLILLDLARLSPSVANLQPLKYILSYEDSMNRIIFPKLKWAGYLKDWDGPEEGEKPSAYIIVLGDTQIARSFGCDHGLSTQNIILGAVSMGLGCCIIGAVNRKILQDELKIPDHFQILHVIALGKPGEKVVVEKVTDTGDIRYWRDDEGVHHVPKRDLSDIIVSVK